MKPTLTYHRRATHDRDRTSGYVYIYTDGDGPLCMVTNALTFATHENAQRFAEIHKADYSRTTWRKPK